MRLERMTGVLALVAGVALGGVVAAEPAAAPAKTAGGAVRLEPTVKAKSEGLGVEHKLLNGFVGHWKSTIHLPQDETPPTVQDAAPGQPSNEAQGAADGKLTMGGRFAMLTHSGVMNKQPYEGMILLGFDGVIQRYTAIWIDTNSPAFISYVGTYDAAKKQLMMEAHFSQQVTRRFTISKIVLEFPDADTIVLDEHVAHAAGEAGLHTRTITFKRG